MKDTTKFVGLDVSKEKIAVGVADGGRESARYWGVRIPTKSTTCSGPNRPPVPA